MQCLTRRETLTLLIGGSAACCAPLPSAQAQAKAPVSNDLAKAIRTFNARAATQALGKTQPPLTQDEVIAAIRWINVDKSEHGVTEVEYAALLKIAETGQLPPGAALEVLTKYEPNDTLVVSVWSVRLRMPHGEYGGTYAFPIREQRISSRLIGPEERKVIQKWEKKWQEQGGIASFDRLPYAQERQHAMQLDQAKPK